MNTGYGYYGQYGQRAALPIVRPMARVAVNPRWRPSGQAATTSDPGIVAEAAWDPNRPWPYAPGEVIDADLLYRHGIPPDQVAQGGDYRGLGDYGKVSNQERCAAAKAKKRAGKKTYRWRNVDSQIGKFCKGAEGEVEALEAAKEAAGMGKGWRKQQRRAERAAMSGPDPVLIFGGLAALGLLMAGVIVMRKKPQ